MTLTAVPRDTLPRLDEPTAALVRLSAIITGGSDQSIRDGVTRAATEIPAVWVEELLLQSYLFAGFPRALNAMREWRRVQPDPLSGSAPLDIDRWRAEGEATCAAVYGAM